MQSSNQAPRPTQYLIECHRNDVVATPREQIEVVIVHQIGRIEDPGGDGRDGPVVPHHARGARPTRAAQQPATQGGPVGPIGRAKK